MTDTTETTPRRVSRNLKNLFLDPNNYRFIDNEKYEEVSENELLSPNVQKRTTRFIEGEKRKNIADLIASFRANGFLNVDVIQLKSLGENNYLVLEGNRRVAALKALQEDYELGYDIGKLDPNIFKSVPSDIHDHEDQDKHTIIMGLKHISGNKPWPAINQAKLIYDYTNVEDYEQRQLREKELISSLGVTMHWLRATLRAYNLILQYQRSDFGDQFESEMYSLFVETIKRPNIKDWLGWNDVTYRAENNINLERFFSWISSVEREVDEDVDELGYYDNGSVEVISPIIERSHEIRELSSFIDNEAALQEMERTRSISYALAKSGVIQKESYRKNILVLRETVEELSRLKDLISESEITTLKVIQSQLDEIVPKASRVSIKNTDYSVCFKTSNIQHFSEFEIEQYRVFKGFKLENLNRINIFAGLNNTGKTSLLEAIYLLTKQNEIGAYFELLKLRNKLTDLNPYWLKDYSNEEILVSGIFNKVQTRTNIKKFDASDIDKESDYVASYQISAAIDSQTLDAIIHTFGYDDIRRQNDNVEVLCNSIFKSPYFYNHDEVIESYKQAIRTKIDDKSPMDDIIDFIKKVDPKIRKIGQATNSDLERFYVDAANFRDYVPDITTYGEGVQRVWELALSFASARNGVLLIDELETAIHKSLLDEFTRFIQQLAIQFNTQVFLTSHSKECIDSFIFNDFRLEDISAYTLSVDESGKIKNDFISGEKLQKMLDFFNADIRGSK